MISKVLKPELQIGGSKAIKGIRRAQNWGKGLVLYTDFKKFCLLDL